jgi:hypothetical protein
MRLSRKTLIELAICVGLFGAAGIAWLSSEIRWARINSPVGKFTSAPEYLAAERLPSRITKLTTNGSTFFIAYSPMDYRLAVPSGPAAYVFDESGHLVAWSRDTGDDGRFQRSWPLRQQAKASIEDLKRLGFQDGTANRIQPMRSDTNRTSPAAGSSDR